MLKIAIDREKCVGHGRCAAVAPGVFPLDAQGFISITEVIVNGEQERVARRAARACPERIIEIVDDSAAG